jgi:hypothetical protein
VGIFNSFKAATLYIAITDTPSWVWFFKKDRYPFKISPSLRLNFYCWTRDLIRIQSLATLLLVISVYSSLFSASIPPPIADPARSWISLFIWENFKQFSFKKDAMTILTSENASEPTFVCLRYYRTDSDGWKYGGNSDTCVLEYQQTLRPFTDCRLLAVGNCNIWRRQRPSLRDSAAQVVFKNIFKLELFYATADTTYRQYIYAVRSRPCIFLESSPSRISLDSNLVPFPKLPTLTPLRLAR